jgi:hypothetical protein
MDSASFAEPLEVKEACIVTRDCVDGRTARTIIHMAFRSLSMHTTYIGVGKDGNESADADICSWIKAHRSSPHAYILLFDVCPSLEVRACMLKEWKSGSVVHMFLGDHHEESKEDIDVFCDAVADIPGIFTTFFSSLYGGKCFTGCTLASWWTYDNGFTSLMKPLNPRVLHEIACSESSGANVKICRYLEECPLEEYESVLTASGTAYREFRDKGGALIFSDKMQELLGRVAESAGMVMPETALDFICQDSGSLVFPKKNAKLNSSLENTTLVPVKILGFPGHTGYICIYIWYSWTVNSFGCPLCIGRTPR